MSAWKLTVTENKIEAICCQLFICAHTVPHCFLLAK